MNSRSSTEIGAILAAKQANAAGAEFDGTTRAPTRSVSGYFRAQSLDNSGQFVAEHRRRRDHARVVAALPDLEIGAAGERHLHANQRLVRRQARNIDAFDLQILAAVENGGGHVTVSRPVSELTDGV